MCLNLNKAQLKSRYASGPIECYKVLVKRIDRDPIYGTPVDALYSPYQSYYRWTLGEVEGSALMFDELVGERYALYAKDYNRFGIAGPNGIVEEGLHSFINKADALEFVKNRVGVSVFKAEIPAGATYYQGTWFSSLTGGMVPSYASSLLKVLEEVAVRNKPVEEYS